MYDLRYHIRKEKMILRLEYMISDLGNEEEKRKKRENIQASLRKSI
jgi:hypothetical protein